MLSFIDINKIVVTHECKKSLQLLYQHYIIHEFDLLGSGFQEICYGMEVSGFEHVCYRYNRKFLFEKNRFRRNRFISKHYKPINWFIDYKSGFYFDPFFYNTKDKCLNIIEKKREVDIKCPWELGRFYHFPQLAILALSDIGKRKPIIIEFKDEIYDFIISNPIGRTVQWSGIMDVSIRVVNLLVTYDILKKIDIEKLLDNKFNELFCKFILESSEYIINNLEYNGKRQTNTNHYLSNLVGILFAASYLGSTVKTDAWLVFAVQEIIDQFKKQFNKDGSNYEGSTSYHRLSTEIIVYSTALIYGVLDSEKRNSFKNYDRTRIGRLLSFNKQRYNLKSNEFFPFWYIERLYKAGKFTKAILKENNEVVQIGDNDNGRLIKLTPQFVVGGYDGEENTLDHRGLLSNIGALFSSDIYKKDTDILPLEYTFIKSLINGKEWDIPESLDPTIRFENIIDNIELKYKKETVIVNIKEKDSLLKNAEIEYFSDFGLLILKTHRLFISFVIGTPLPKRPLGHRHNDSLSVEIMLDGKYVTRDTGSYVYTADPEIRNRFRSVKAHNTIHVKDCEQNMFTDTFGMIGKAKSKLLYYSESLMLAKAEYGKVEHIRKIEIKDDSVVITDYSNFPFTVSFNNKLVSTGYGRKIVKK